LEGKIIKTTVHTLYLLRLIDCHTKICII
jgi:hypothetical protein